LTDLPAAADRPLRRRAALASTLLAGLELARDGSLTLHQDHAFGAIRLTPSPGEAPRPTAAA
jgi:segregation and condensation protein A